MGKSNGTIPETANEVNDDMRIPYFMTNDEWYYFDDSAEYKNAKLTDEGKAIPEVVESYKEFYSTHYDEEGNVVDY